MGCGMWHQGGINRGDSPRWTVIAYYQRAWLKGKIDSVCVLLLEALAERSAEAKEKGISRDYSGPGGLLEGQSPQRQRDRSADTGAKKSLRVCRLLKDSRINYCRLSPRERLR